MPRLWLLTDSDCLRERMPRALVRALRARGLDPQVLVADRGTASWRGLDAGDLVVARTRAAAGLALLEAAELHGARTFERAVALRTARNKAQAAAGCGAGAGRARPGVRGAPRAAAGGHRGARVARGPGRRRRRRVSELRGRPGGRRRGRRGGHRAPRGQRAVLRNVNIARGSM